MAIMTVHKTVTEDAQREQAQQNPIAGDVGTVFEQE